MSVATDPGTEAQLSRHLLRAIDAYHSHHWEGPTVPELAADLGIAPDFGHDDLAVRLERELSRGRVSNRGSRYRLTRAGRALAESEA
jgi:hypothetical protein